LKPIIRQYRVIIHH